MRFLALLLLLVASPALALYEGLQCVPYARAVSGVEIYGDAHTWWDQAQGRYQRGSTPKVGAIMSFRPHGAMQLGHVAAVRKIIDARTVLISHANWSTIDGQRGHIEENIRAVDASENNDWSAVQIWYTPNQALGGTRWPLNGFIYADTKRSDRDVRLAVAQLTGRDMAPAAVKSEIRVASVEPKPTARAASFQLSSKTIADVNQKAASEKQIAWRKPAPVAARRDAIGDLIGTLGS
jgi:surface antigen